MEKRYTLPVAIALVVGTVIGSGVFFKAEAVLTKTGGNLSVGILAFIIMGVVMIISACTFGVVAQNHQDVEGLVGYARASCGKTYGYYVGWFMAVIYYPSLVAVLSWLPARYFGVLMGWEDAVVGGRRLRSAVRRSLEAVRRALSALESGLTPDAVLTDVEEALAALGELTGRTVREDVTARIFERFCVGK